MAQIVAAMGSVHNPLLMAGPARVEALMWDKFERGFAALRQTLQDSGADTVVVISDEHFNALSPRHYPSFGVVAAETCRGPSENWLGVACNSITVNCLPELAEAIMREGLQRGFDLTRIGEAGLDHGFLTCLHHMTPDWNLSYVWLIQNCVLPPLPSVKRCYDFGRMVGNAIRSWDSPRRVALLGTGGLSHAVGTPDMGSVDEPLIPGCSTCCATTARRSAILPMPRWTPGATGHTRYATGLRSPERSTGPRAR